MKPIKFGISVCVSALLLISNAQAAPTPPIKQPPPPVDHIHMVCKTTIKDINGHLIGQRITRDDRTGLVAKHMGQHTGAHYLLIKNGRLESPIPW
jgi:hypothetical protein